MNCTLPQLQPQKLKQTHPVVGGGLHTNTCISTVFKKKKKKNLRAHLVFLYRPSVQPNNQGPEKPSHLGPLLLFFFTFSFLALKNKIQFKYMITVSKVIQLFHEELPR
jgi:hypothetical protein